MKQVNLTITDEDHAKLVVEAGKRQVESGKIIRISSLAYELLKPTIASLNNNPPTDTPTEKQTQDDKQEETHPLAALDLG